MARRDPPAAALQNFIAVATSPGAIVSVPLTSAGLSGSVGSAATRSHSASAADCACAGLKAPGETCTNRPINKLQAAATAPDRFIMAAIVSLRHRPSKQWQFLP